MGTGLRGLLLLVGLLGCFGAACGDINVTDDEDVNTQICVAGSQRCDGVENVEQCSADGTRFLFFDECPSTERCDGGVCVPKAACTEGEVRCSGDANAEIVCVSSAWTFQTACWGGLCSGGACP